ncbi:MAG: hypothetical protein XD51_0755 [Moorella sp. 60_41]|nr:MAG: hypothetical protein XD51_0755 [Moorella sp. 60_41]
MLVGYMLGIDLPELQGFEGRKVDEVTKLTVIRFNFTAFNAERRRILRMG